MKNFFTKTKIIIALLIIAFGLFVGKAVVTPNIDPPGSSRPTNTHYAIDPPGSIPPVAIDPPGSAPIRG